MRNRVLWNTPGYKPRKPVVGAHITEYLIVGGGIAGLATAHFLIKGGVRPRDIMVVEKDTVGSGSTGRSAGMLVAEPESEDNLGWKDMVVRFGLANARAYRRELMNALRTAKGLIRSGKIECEPIATDLLALSKSAQGAEALMQEARSLSSFGERSKILQGVHLTSELAVSGFTHANRTSALSVNPLVFVRGIAAYLEKKGVRIYERSAYLDTTKSRARFPRGSVLYARLILTTGNGMEAPRLAKFLTTIAVTKKLSRVSLRALALEDKDMFSDEPGDDSFHYAKVTGDNRLLIGYGDVRVKTRVSEARLHAPHVRDIKRFLARTFPHASLPIEYAWSGVYVLSKDNLPFVRITRKAAVLNGAGTQLASIAAAGYVTAKLLGKKHPLDRFFGHTKVRGST